MSVVEAEVPDKVVGTDNVLHSFLERIRNLPAELVPFYNEIVVLAREIHNVRARALSASGAHPDIINEPYISTPTPGSGDEPSIADRLVAGQPFEVREKIEDLQYDIRKVAKRIQIFTDEQMAILNTEIDDAGLGFDHALRDGLIKAQKIAVEVTAVNEWNRFIRNEDLAVSSELRKQETDPHYEPESPSMLVNTLHIATEAIVAHIEKELLGQLPTVVDAPYGSISPITIPSPLTPSPRPSPTAKAGNGSSPTSTMSTGGIMGFFRSASLFKRRDRSSPTGLSPLPIPPSAAVNRNSH